MALHIIAIQFNQRFNYNKPYWRMTTICNATHSTEINVYFAHTVASRLNNEARAQSKRGSSTKARAQSKKHQNFGLKSSFGLQLDPFVFAGCWCPHFLLRKNQKSYRISYHYFFHFLVHSRSLSRPRLFWLHRRIPVFGLKHSQLESPKRTDPP